MTHSNTSLLVHSQYLFFKHITNASYSIFYHTKIYLLSFVNVGKRKSFSLMIWQFIGLQYRQSITDYTNEGSYRYYCLKAVEKMPNDMYENKIPDLLFLWYHLYSMDRFHSILIYVLLPKFHW